MFGLSGFTLHLNLYSVLMPLGQWGVTFGQWNYFLNPIKGMTYLLIAIVLTFTAKNSIELLDSYQSRYVTLVFNCLIALVALSMMNGVSEFLYFNF